MPEFKRPVSLGARLVELLRAEGVTDGQTAYELAAALEPLVRRLIESHEGVVTK